MCGGGGGGYCSNCLMGPLLHTVTCILRGYFSSLDREPKSNFAVVIIIVLEGGFIELYLTVPLGSDCQFWVCTVGHNSVKECLCCKNQSTCANVFCLPIRPLFPSQMMLRPLA